MNLLDGILVALLLLSLVTGFRRGAVLQVIVYGGLLLGLLIGALVAPRTAGLVDSPVAQATVALATFLSLAAIGDAIGWAIGTRVWAATRRSGLGVLDSWAGSGVAAVATLLAVWFIAFNLVQGPFPAVARQIHGSAVVRIIDGVLPRPPSVLAQVRGLLDRFGFPEVFADLPPAPAGPVEGPNRGQVGRAFDAADQSTLKIVGQACDRIQEGSGFIAADGYVVTNAHVVAGVADPEVQEQGGGSFPATTVLFDPQLDLAVLYVEDPLETALDVLSGDLERGAKGAVLGYPGGGPLEGGAAAVRRVLTAVGRDIYGRRTVEREVYELQASVRPGNSGGPFVTVGGDVAGVIFAASTATEDVGYALTSTEVLPRLEQALGRTAETGTGPCLD